MNFSIAENYSPLNNYNYENKHFLFSSLDWFSTPCRRILGGRNVCVLSQTYENVMSTPRKVATVFFAVLIFPVAIISITSLVIKLATFPFLWENKKVKIQSKETWNIINQFNIAFNNNDYDKAIKSFIKRPEIVERSSIYDTLFKAINLKINNLSLWEDVQLALPFLRNDSIIDLINHAVKVKLSNEFKNDCILMQGKDITNFIQNSLRHADMEEIEACYEKLLSNALQIDTNEDLPLSAIKMDLADHMLRSLTKMRISNAENQLENLMAGHKETLLRYSVFKKGQVYSNYWQIFSSIGDMQKISASVQNMRNIYLLAQQTLNQLSVLSASDNTDPRAQWNDIRNEFVKFNVSLGELVATNEGEKKYINTLQSMFSTMITFIDNILKGASVEEIGSFTQKMEIFLETHTNNFLALLNETKISASKTNIENFLLCLRLKKIAVLFMCTEKMRSKLLEKTAKIAVSL